MTIHLNRLRGASVIRVYYSSGNVIETHEREHAAEFKDFYRAIIILWPWWRPPPRWLNGQIFGATTLLIKARCKVDPPTIRRKLQNTTGRRLGC